MRTQKKCKVPTFSRVGLPQDKKTGATLYKLTLYDQNEAVATGAGFSGGNGVPAIKDGNYMIRLDMRDPNGPNTINPNSAATPQ